ncbi:MAG: hypothetical protein NTY48_07140 [Candidatus Diapherotrites archaeon]|nr:hypothetical protein [Candidatus Diapherotrites archaeon]
MDKRWRNILILLLIVIVVACSWFFYPNYSGFLSNILGGGSTPLSQNDSLLQNDILAIQKSFTDSGVSFDAFNRNDLVKLDADMNVVIDKSFLSLDKVKSSLSSAKISTTEGVDLRDSYKEIIDLEKERKVIFDNLHTLWNTSDSNVVCDIKMDFSLRIGEYSLNNTKLGGAGTKQSILLLDSQLGYPLFSPDFSRDNKILEDLRATYDGLDDYCS